MSFYSYKNADPANSPGEISGSALDGLNEKVCIQVQRVYDSCLQQEQLTNKDVTITSYAQVVNKCCCNNSNETTPPASAPVPPITFESCRSSTTDIDISNLTVERLCDRPCFARVRGYIDIPIDILFTDSRCVEYIGKGVVRVNKDVLLSVPDDSIVPYTLEGMASAICVSGTYRGDNVFRLTICVSIILKVYPIIRPTRAAAAAITAVAATAATEIAITEIRKIRAERCAGEQKRFPACFYCGWIVDKKRTE